jgi:chorismate-pyruvate lyase
MKATHAPIAHSELAEKYVIRIEAHLARLAQGHDPLGHLLAIERLARAARAEWWEAERGAGHSGNER